MLRGIFKATKTAIILSSKRLFKFKGVKLFYSAKFKVKPPHQNMAIAKASVLCHFKAITIASIA